MENIEVNKINLHQPSNSVSLLSELYTNKTNTDLNFFSDGRTVSFHSVILRQSSDFLSHFIDSSETNLIILPGFSQVLSNFVSLVYTGRAHNLTKLKVNLLTSLCTELGIKTINEKDKAGDGNEDNEGENKAFNQFSLKVETDIWDESLQESCPLRLPLSRLDLKSKKRVHDDQGHVFYGFKGRVQLEYNKSPIGPYEGPYDQDPQVPLSAQLSNSLLSYDNYTNFLHPEEFPCKIFKIKQNYECIEDHQKIEALEVSDESSERFTKPDNGKVYYTCKKKFCKIPCPCLICSSNENQCPEHNMKHVDLFDEKEHLFSVRTTDFSCSAENFFSRSYVLKYPGIPKACLRCRKDLLHHKSYHLDFHFHCKFCKLYQYKLYPKSSKELKIREVKEKAWYEKVCPYCDKMFADQYQTKKHIECEHKKNSKIKCDECQKPFQSEQSLKYHKLVQHTIDPQKSYSCNICNKTFLIKVNLDNHVKFKHSDSRNIECKHCNSKFKQRKNLNAHMLNIHGTNPTKEDYWQDIKRDRFECSFCKKAFTRGTDLKVHITVKHSTKDLFNCSHCGTKFSYKNSLERHKAEKHSSELTKYECSHCGKLFNQKRNMQRHQLSHKEK